MEHIRGGSRGVQQLLVVVVVVLLSLPAGGLCFVCTICIVLPRASRFTFRPAHSISSSSFSPAATRHIQPKTHNSLWSFFPSPPSPFRTHLPPAHTQRERERERSRQRRRAVNNPTRPAGSHISELFTLLNKGDFSRARAPNIERTGRTKRKKRKDQGDTTASPRRASS